MRTSSNRNESLSKLAAAPTGTEVWALRLLTPLTTSPKRQTKNPIRLATRLLLLLLLLLLTSFLPEVLGARMPRLTACATVLSLTVSFCFPKNTICLAQIQGCSRHYGVPGWFPRFRTRVGWHLPLDPA
eukprot:4147783-Amphidinium_carterae.1